MKIKRVNPRQQCSATIQPGEYVIDIWDGHRCGETSPYSLARCEHCNEDFCLGMHYHKHKDSIPTMSDAEREMKEDGIFPHDLPY